MLYRLPLGRNGSLPDADDVETIQLGGEFAFDESGLNLNGIDATPDGHTLVAVQTGFGRIYRIDPTTGEAVIIELTGGDGDVRFFDGVLLHGRTLYIVQNRLNRIAVVELSADLSSGTIVGYIEDLEFDVPTTIAEHGRRLYAVNARFGTSGSQPAEYSVVQVSRHLG